MERLLFVALLGITAVAIADGPGSRIRTTPQPQPAGPVDRDVERCESMSGEQKDRCLQALRSAARGAQRPPHEGPGPESTGGGSNAGSGASSGTSGASSASGSAR